MNVERVELTRTKYTGAGSFGRLKVFGTDGSVLFSCLTMEDVVRPIGIKVKGETAIFAGTYEIEVNRSQTFGRFLPYVIGSFGFEGIRIHAGNNLGNTSGCVLIGTKIDPSKNWIEGGSKIIDELTEILNGGRFLFEVKNGFQIG